jgi:tetratricopeptide (TPR) repeat protein
MTSTTASRRASGRTLWICTLACCLSLATAQPQEGAPGDPKQWRHIALERAVAAADHVTDPYRRAETLASVARAQVALGESPHKSIVDALAAAEKVTPAEFKGWVLHEIVLAQIAADDLIGARETVDRIQASRPHGAAAAALAHVQIRSNNFAAAQATVAKMRDIGSQGEILRQIAAIQAARGQIDSALETARPIRDAFYQSIAYGDIAVAEIRGGDVRRAQEIASRARRSFRSQAFQRVVLALHERGDIVGAIAMLPRIQDGQYRAGVQARIAMDEEAGLSAEESERLFAEALSMVSAIPDKEPRKAIVLAQLARTRAVAGHAPQALEILSRALAAARTLPSGPNRDDAFQAVARAFVRAGDTSGAWATAVLVDERTARALLIRDIVMMLGDEEGASVSEIRAAGLGDPLAETAALFGVLGNQLTRSRSVSLSTIDAARDSVRAIAEAPLKPAAFAALAAARVSAGDLPGGWTIFQEALSVAEQIERPDQRAAAYVRIINALNDRLMFLGQPAERPKEETEAASAVAPTSAATVIATSAVIPTQGGIQCSRRHGWAPAFAGVTAPLRHSGDHCIIRGPLRHSDDHCIIRGPLRHSDAGRNPVLRRHGWAPAFAGVTAPLRQS